MHPPLRALGLVLWPLLLLVHPLSIGAPSAAVQSVDPGPDGDGTVTIGPEYKLDPDLADQGKPKGKSFVFSRATGHCDGKVFRQTLADTLVWTWRGYPVD